MNRKLLIIIGAIFAVGAVAGMGIAKVRKSAAAASTGKVVKTPDKPVEFEEFLVNLSDRDQSHYLKVKVVLMVKDTPDAPKRMEEATPQIRDAMIMTMSQRTYRALLSAEGKASLKTALRRQINGVLKGDLVTDVYFTSFAMQ